MENETFNTQETSENQPASSDVMPSAPKAPERTFTQDEVNKIVAANKKQLQEKYDSTRVNQPPVAPPAGQMETAETVAKRVFAEELKKAQEIAKQEQLKAEYVTKWNTLATSLSNKIEAGKSKYEDWDKVTAEVDFSAVPQVLEAANDVDNSVDVLYELSANPAKLGSIMSLLQNQSAAMQALGKKEIQKLSLALKNAEIAANRVPTKKPLTPIKPSNVTPDSGQATWAELRAKYTSRV